MSQWLTKTCMICLSSCGLDILSRRMLWKTVLEVLLKSKKIININWSSLINQVVYLLKKKKLNFKTRTFPSWRHMGCDLWLHCPSTVFQYHQNNLLQNLTGHWKWDWEAHSFQGLLYCTRSPKPQWKKKRRMDDLSTEGEEKNIFTISPSVFLYSFPHFFSFLWYDMKS